MDVRRSDYVLERRINLPVRTVHGVLLRDATLVAGTRIAAGTDAELLVDGNLRAVPIATATSRSWVTTGRLVTRRRRRLAVIEVEVSTWGSGSTFLQLRPTARHPERWSARRSRGYFDAVHEAADEIARLVHAGAERRVPTRAVAAAPRVARAS
jgi:hypothetical protein